jgi:hypothetical protein
MHSHDWVAGIIGGSTVVGLVSVFVIGQIKTLPPKSSRK